MDIAAWLRELGLDRYEAAFRDNAIDAEVLPDLTDADLQKLGVLLGHRKKLLKAIAALRAGASAPDSLPEAAVEAPPEPRRAAEAERRQLTVMFCDLVGSTALSARLDPEDLGEVMRTYQNCCANVVKRWGGHVAKYMGDGVLAYFGWPQAHEDDAERAVRAGLKLVEVVAGLEPHAEVRLQARVGIATGQVVVGDFVGEGAARDEAVVGETPNLAARLQALAQPGTVVISQATRRLVGGLFELDDLGPRRLKGFAEPLVVWRVARESRTEGRFEARQTTGLTPLVGRAEEIALPLRRWRQARGGEGQVVLLSSEPGIGKSRIVREVRARLQDEPHVSLLYQCSPYHATSPLHPVIEQLERAAGFVRGDPPEARMDKLEALLKRGTSKLDEAAPLLAALLGIASGERYPALDLTPQRQKQLTLEALLDQLEGLAAEQPVLVVHEDVHWIDPTTQELLGLAIERIPSLPVLFLITFRPGFSPPWSGQPHVSSLALTRLGQRDGATMVDRVVGAKSLPAEVSEQIVAKADGVPLFVEELTKTVLELGLLADAGDHYELASPFPSLAIPATLHDSLLARLDRLAPVKEVAQIGAAIGREFSYELLAAVANRREADLQAALDELVSSELVFRQGTSPEAMFSFKHALVRDAAYGTLLKSKRQHLHAYIAKVLEEDFPATAETQPELVAYHCTEAGLAEKAAEYWRRAGQLAISRSAHKEAIAQLTKGVRLLASLPDGPARRQRELELQFALGRALTIAEGEAAPDTGRAFARATELCAQAGESPHHFPALYGQYLFHFARGELTVAQKLARQFLQLAESQNDMAVRATGHRIVGVVSLLLGRPSAARVHLERALALDDPALHASPNFLYPYDSRVLCLSYLSCALLVLGYPEQALSHTQHALAEAQALAHPESLAFAMAEAAGLYQDLRNAEAVREQAEPLIALATVQAFPHFMTEGMMLQGWVLAQEGEFDEAIAQMRRSLTVTRGSRKGIGMPYRLLSLAGVHMTARQMPEALDVLAEALDLVRNTGECWFEPELHRVKGEVLLRLSPQDQAAAEACFGQAIAVARAQGARLWELRAATSLARLWHDQGKPAEAHDLLAPVYGWFTEGFDTADLADAKALLDELS